jgi:hypothetical protein
MKHGREMQPLGSAGIYILLRDRGGTPAAKSLEVSHGHSSLRSSSSTTSFPRVGAEFGAVVTKADQKFLKVFQESGVT